MIDENIIFEANRLFKKFGNTAIDVVSEIKKYDNNDIYFWQCVENYIINHLN